MILHEPLKPGEKREIKGRSNTAKALHAIDDWEMEEPKDKDFRWPLNADNDPWPTARQELQNSNHTFTFCRQPE